MLKYADVFILENVTIYTNHRLSKLTNTTQANNVAKLWKTINYKVRVISYLFCI